MKKIPIIVILGPTATGKTSLAISLSKIYNGEIISADSMQIYKGMDIATAKPTLTEMDGITHHLISFVDQTAEFSVADFVRLAREKIIEITSRGKLPVICGGTGLYITSLLDNINFNGFIGDKNVRSRLLNEAKVLGNEAMLDKLKNIDFAAAEDLHPNNITRIVRALEVCEVTNAKFSEVKILSRMEETQYDACVIGLNFRDRQKLYERINQRVDIMLKNGLLEEALALFNNNNLKTAHQAIGYKELVPYFSGEKSLDYCVENLKQSTRRYAKRQLTWFRRDERIQWIYIDEKNVEEKIIENCKKIIANKLKM